MYRIRYTGQEFEILWAAHGRDRLPYPLHYRTHIAGFDELRRHREAAVESLLGKYEAEVERALEILLEPDARVESKGLGAPDMSRVFRFHGAVRGRAGATVTQEPGTAPDTGGDVVLTCCAATEVATQAVASLPPTGPGARPPLEVRREAVAAERDRYVRRAHEPSLTEQLDRIFKRPRLALGEISVFPGAAVDARPAPGRGFWWMDYDDGRYYVKTGDPIIAEPVARPALAAEIHRLITLTQRYYQDDLVHEDDLRSRR